MYNQFYKYICFNIEMVFAVVFDMLQFSVVFNFNAFIYFYSSILLLLFIWLSSLRETNLGYYDFIQLHSL